MLLGCCLLNEKQKIIRERKKEKKPILKEENFSVVSNFAEMF